MFVSACKASGAKCSAKVGSAPLKRSRKSSLNAASLSKPATFASIHSCEGGSTDDFSDFLLQSDMFLNYMLRLDFSMLVLFASSDLGKVCTCTDLYARIPSSGYITPHICTTY